MILQLILLYLIVVLATFGLVWSIIYPVYKRKLDDLKQEYKQQLTGVERQHNLKINTLTRWYEDDLKKRSSR